MQLQIGQGAHSRAPDNLPIGGIAAAVTGAGKRAVGLGMDETAKMGANIVERVIASIILLQKEARPLDVSREGRQALGHAESEHHRIRPRRTLAHELRGLPQHHPSRDCPYPTNSFEERAAGDFRQLAIMELHTTFLCNISSPAIPQPADEIANHGSGQARRPMHRMRQRIKGYSPDEVTGEAEAENPNIDYKRPVFLFCCRLRGFGMLAQVSSHSAAYSFACFRQTLQNSSDERERHLAYFGIRHLAGSTSSDHEPSSLRCMGTGNMA